MEERDQILIERYLAGELTEAERQVVEQRLDADPLFREEISAYQVTLEALRQKQREELRQRFAMRDEILDKKKPEQPISGRYRFIWPWVAATAIAVLVIWRLFLVPKHQPIPTESNVIDTTQIDETPVSQVDTVALKDSLHNQQQNGRLKAKQPEKAGSPKKGEELFAEYFEPYKDAMMDPTTRGDEHWSPLQKYQKAYWDGKYQEAVKLFLELSPDYQHNDNYRFSFANALLETGKTQQATSIFESIIQNNRSRYIAEAHFGLAMGQLRKENTDQANLWLTKYVQLEKAKKKEQANEIIQKLKE